jgi:hypothetical protein
MIDDALGADRLIGVIQPGAHVTLDGAVPLAEVGTVARITSFSETDDGRYLITLTGLCRFRVERELPQAGPYRVIAASYDEFGDDLKPGEARIDREKLRHALQRYVDTHGYQADWSAVDEAPSEALVNSVSTICPFDPPAKQALLEAPTLADRCAALIALLEWGADEDDGSYGTMQ